MADFDGDSPVLTCYHKRHRDTCEECKAERRADELLNLYRRAAREPLEAAARAAGHKTLEAYQAHLEERRRAERAAAERAREAERLQQEAMMAPTPTFRIDSSVWRETLAEAVRKGPLRSGLSGLGKPIPVRKEPEPKPDVPTRTKRNIKLED